MAGPSVADCRHYDPRQEQLLKGRDSDEQRGLLMSGFCLIMILLLAAMVERTLVETVGIAVHCQAPMSQRHE